VTGLEQLESTFAAAASHVAALDGRFLLPALGLQLANLALRSFAWRNVLAAAYPDRRVPVLRVAAAYTAGVGMNSFLPARGGDVAKLVLVRTQLPGSSLATIGAALGVLVAFDVVLGTTLVLTLGALGLLPALPAIPSVGVLPAVAVAAALAVGAVLVRRRPRWLGRVVAPVARGFSVVRSPRRYAATVLPLQLASWACRVGVVLLVLAAFRIEVEPQTAALVVVLNGLSTVVPVPGGAGAQQVLASYALQGAAPVAGALSFSVGLQLGVTAVNLAVATAGAMLLVRTIRPLAALQGAAALARRTD
jgi:uncharacterized membrane protein YbhN (UPF0104 family)